MVTKHPLLPRAVPLVLGIAVAGGAWIYALSVGMFFTIANPHFRKRENLVGGIAWFCLGVALLAFRMNYAGPNDLRIILGNDPELVTVRGILTAEPEHRVLDQDQKTRHRTTARVRVEELEREKKWEPASGQISVSTTGFVSEEFVAGSRVEISGVLARPQGPLAPGLFDYERHLKWQRTFFLLRAESTNDWIMAQQAEGLSAAAFYRRFNQWARATLQRGLPDDENTRLLWAMTLGWRPGLTNEVSELFQKSGTLHIFAISGLHIAMMAWMLVKGFGRVGLSRNWAGLLALPIIWFYTGATGWQASAVRSTIMSSVVIVGWVLKRPNNLLNSLAASAIIILSFWQPEQLFQPGFQLSFLLLLTIAVWPALASSPWPDPTLQLGQREAEAFSREPDENAWAKFLARFYQFATGRDPLLPAEFRPWWRRKLDRPLAWLFGGVNLSVASLVCSLPVIAGFFNLISLSSVLANLVIVPMSGIALGASMASLVMGWLPLLPEFANSISWTVMKWMVAFCRALENYEWTFAYVKSPGEFNTVLYYLSIGCLLAGHLKRLKVAIPLFAAVAAAVAHGLHREATTTEVTVLPGSGVIYIDQPWSANDVIVDCGREREAMSIVKSFLRSRGVDRLSAIVLTHGDVEHVDGYIRLAEEFHVKQTIISPAKSRSPRYRDVLRVLEGDEKVRKVSAGDQVSEWSVLHPPRGVDFAKADDEAVVLLGKVGTQRVLLMSDLGRLGQDRLAESAPQADVVICGRSVPEVLRPSLFEKVKPKTIVLTGNVPKVPEIPGVRVVTTEKAAVISSKAF